MKIISTRLSIIIKNILKKLGFVNNSFYINGSDMLPAPLSTEEENEILQLL